MVFQKSIPVISNKRRARAAGVCTSTLLHAGMPRPGGLGGTRLVVLAWRLVKEKYAPKSSDSLGVI